MIHLFINNKEKVHIIFQASANSAILPSRTGTPMVRSRPPVPPPIQNRMPLNRLPRGLPGSSLVSGPLPGGQRVRPLFRPSGPTACSSFSSVAVSPLRPRITPPFFARRQPFPLRPLPPGMRPPRPPFLRQHISKSCIFLFIWILGFIYFSKRILFFFSEFLRNSDYMFQVLFNNLMSTFYCCYICNFLSFSLLTKSRHIFLHRIRCSSIETSHYTARNHMQKARH